MGLPTYARLIHAGTDGKTIQYKDEDGRDIRNMSMGRRLTGRLNRRIKLPNL